MIDSKLIFRDALLSLSKTKKLSKITVKDLVEEAGTARQTFYNNFHDLNEAISYTGISFFASKGISIGHIETVRFALECALQHKEFFRQLATLTGQNNYRDSLYEWEYAIYYRAFVEGVADERERMIRDLIVRYSLHGGVDLFLDWCASGMVWPVDVFVAALEARRCDFHDPSLMEAVSIPPSRNPK